MHGARRAAAVALVTAVLPIGAARAEVPVDLELVLAVDVSGSMDPDEQTLQREGYVAALVHPEVLRAIETGIYGRIAITYVEWAGAEYQFHVVPWTEVGDVASVRGFAAAIAERPLRRFRGTSISGVLDFAAALFEANGYEGIRRVIDVSGDGPNNSGRPVEAARDAVLEAGITINGLPIIAKAGQGGFWSIADLDVYYADCVIGGPGSFMIPVREIDEFADAIRQKLILEIADLEPAIVPAASAPAQARRSDCMVGERQRRQWDP